MEIVKNLQGFAGLVVSAKNEWDQAQTSFFCLIEYWQMLSVKSFGRNVEIKQTQGRSELKGVVLGKEFSVELRPITVKGIPFAEAVVKILFDEKTHIEATRFLLNRRSNVVQYDGAVLIDVDGEELGSAMLFASIINAVMEASYPKPI